MDYGGVHFQDVLTLSTDSVLDHEVVDHMSVRIYLLGTTSLKVDNRLLSGYSRIPIHEPGRPLAFVGLLLVKKVG